MTRVARAFSWCLTTCVAHTRVCARVARLLMMCTAALIGGSPIAFAQEAASIPVRPLRIIAVSDSTTLRSVANVRAIPDSRVIVNDVSNRRLVTFDSTLRAATTIADTTSTLSYTYGLKPKPSGLVRWTSDSSLFIDNDALAILVINPRGVVDRIIGAVKNADVPNIAGGSYGLPAGDGQGRLLYATDPAFDPYAKLPTVGGPPLTATYPDSTAIVRADFQKRVIDTVARLRAPVKKILLTAKLNGGVDVTAVANPLPSADDWTVLPDGTIAIIRARDYHIDWISPDGVHTSTPSMPFDWRNISPAEKQQMVDSVKRGMDEARAKEFAKNAGTGTAAAPTLNVTVDAKDIPDAYPPVRPGTTRADMNGRVWLLPATSSAARNGLLYDVVGRDGKIVERVQLPLGRALVGFGPENIVYLNAVKGPNKSVLERAEIVR